MFSHGIVLAIVSSVLSSCAAVFQTYATKELSPWCVASFGNLLGGALIVCFVAIPRAGAPAHARLGAQSMKSVMGPLVMFVLLRGICGGILFNLGLSYTIAIKAVFLTKAEPYFVLFWDWLLDGKRIPRRHLLLLLLHLLGAAALSGVTADIGIGQLGDLLLLISVCLSALTYRFGATLSHQFGSLRTSAILQICSGLLLLPLPLLLTPEQSLSFQHPWAWGYLAAYVILFSVLGLTLWLVAIRTVDLWIVSALRATGPLVAAPLAWILFGEELSLVQITGGIVVILTSALIASERRPASFTARSA